MATVPPGDDLPDILHRTLVQLVRSNHPDLTARQLAMFLVCYTTSEGQTVRGLAAMLGVPKPSITRSIDRLSEIDLVQRKPDREDRRSVLVGRTAKGAAFIRELAQIMHRSVAATAAPRKRAR